MKSLSPQEQEFISLSKGFTALSYPFRRTHSSVEVYHDYDLLAGRSTMVNNPPIVMRRLVGKQKFVFDVRSPYGDSCIEKVVDFLDNPQLLSAILKDARGREDFTTRDKNGSDISLGRDMPSEYEVSDGGIYYKVFGLEALTGDNPGEMQQLWVDRVKYLK
jgi:hypothetical protein